MPFSAHAVATTNKFVRTWTLAMMRMRVMLEMARKACNITYDGEGQNYQWPVKMKRTPLEGNADGDTNTFARRDKGKKAILPMRSYKLTESINEADKLMNKGDSAIVKLWNDKAKELTGDFNDQFPVELVTTDGQASGNEKKFHGLATLFTGNTSSAGNLVAVNVPSYAGLSTARGNYSGSITGTWPTGVISGPDYDFFSPLHIDTSNTGWTASTKTWQYNAPEQVRFAIINTERNGDRLSYIVADKQNYRLFLDALDEKEKINVQKGAGESQMVKSGFTAVNYDGVDITWGDELASGTAFGICNNAFKIVSWQGQLLVIKTDYDIETASDRILAQCYGNLVYLNPRALCYFSAVS